MHDPYFPVPFVFADLPVDLKPLVAAAGESGLEASSARLAIAEHWQGGGARAPALLLAYAYLGVKDACEIMVDEQLDMAREALELVAEARAAGAPETPGLGAFVTLAEEIAGAEQERKDELEGYLMVDPATMDEELAGDVAYELCERGRQGEAVAYFDRVIVLVPEPQKLHYQWNRASCLAKVGKVDEAKAFYRYVVRERSDADPMLVSAAYSGLLEHEPKDDGFRELFRRALAWAAEREQTFPHVLDHQERFLERAVRCGMRDIALHLCGVIEARDQRIPAELKVEIAAARQRFA